MNDSAIETSRSVVSLLVAGYSSQKLTRGETRLSRCQWISGLRYGSCDDFRELMDGSVLPAP